jgi:hypothetical protein
MRYGVSIGLMLVALTCAAQDGMAAKGPKKSQPMPTKPPVPGKTYSWSFQADTLGQKPAYTVAFGGTWQVIEDPASSGATGTTAASPELAANGESAQRFLTQSDGEDGIAYHYLTFTRPFLADLDASVRFRIKSGEMDPSAGLLFQMDPKGTSGYLVRVSGKSGEIVFHYLLYGKRRDVKYAKIDPPTSGTWHTLAIERRGTVLRASYDGSVLLTVRDDRFSKGNIGVWSEDDTLVDFADLTATAR